MIATVINALAVVVGSLVGLFLRKGIKEQYQKIIFAAAGITSLVIGIQMALTTEHLLAFALALILGGLAGTALNIEGSIMNFGERLKNRFDRSAEGTSFATGFLNASVLFCSGAMAIVGSFKAGTEGDYSIIFTKSILDGFMSMIFAGALGKGVIFSALSVLIYQGALTILSVWIKPFVTEIMLSELTAIGGALVIMIGLGLLDIKKIKTADFIPALLVTVLLVLALPFAPFL
ncbi:MAG: DUF554 domain-containing protein [Spirochaetia bacterium]|jgi:uncharacterized membrane protein YqgA involved in biofilm formation|nr:DUF554 domain-containing protein [Spirochaetales bacterium]MDX9784580.1 DUF554 domain-containing protein [Spirochaetia bacterium]